MNILDIILILTIAGGAYAGYRMGLVKQLSFGVGLAAGISQAVHSYTDVSEWIMDGTGWEEGVCITAAFILIMFVITSAVYLVGLLLSKVIKMVCLGPIDRILGTAFAIYFFMTIMAAIVDISGWLYPENSLTGQTAQEGSLLYKEIVGTTFSVLEEVIE
ncbi:MAG: CvpA family protein [Bacteroidaceae bacterium]|nr:CvpA family protein [Bacteroidaceae bacterium]